jgi:hypothetical protein
MQKATRFSSLAWRRNALNFDGHYYNNALLMHRVMSKLMSVFQKTLALDPTKTQHHNQLMRNLLELQNSAAIVSHA